MIKIQQYPKIEFFFNLFSKKYYAEVILFVGGITFHLWSLMRFPFPFVDEAWFACRAWNFISTGQAVGTLDFGVFDRFQGFETYFPWFPVLIQSLAMRLFNQPELIAVRMVSLIFALILSISIYIIGTKLGGRSLGLMSCFILIFSTPYIYSGHLGRYDILVSAFGFCGIALFLLQSRPMKFLINSVIGILILLSFEIHPNGAIYTPVILIMYLYESRTRVFANKGFWGFLVGAGIGGLFYLERHILRYPETYRAITNLAFSQTHIPPILTFNLKSYLDGLLSTYLLFAIHMILIPVLLMGLIHLFVSVINNPSNQDKILLALTLLLLLSYALWIKQKHAYYAIVTSPILSIIAGRYLIISWRQWKGQWNDYASRIAWGLTIVSFVYIITQMTFNANDYTKVAQERIASSISEEDKIMGSQIHWFGLYRNQYYSWETIIYFERLFPGKNFKDAMYEFQPDIFIFDGHMKIFITEEENLENSYKEHLFVPIYEVRQFMESEAQMVDSFYSPIFGPIEIYRIYWDENSNK